MTKPLLVLIMILACCYTYFILSVAHYTQFWRLTTYTQELEYEDPSLLDLVLWALFYFTVGMSIWSLGEMVFREPGYIPNNCSYDPERMSRLDNMFYLQLKRMQHSTMAQKKQVLEIEGLRHGSVTGTSQSSLQLCNSVLVGGRKLTVCNGSQAQAAMARLAATASARQSEVPTEEQDVQSYVQMDFIAETECEEVMQQNDLCSNDHAANFVFRDERTPSEMS